MSANRLIPNFLDKREEEELVKNIEILFKEQIKKDNFSLKKEPEYIVFPIENPSFLDFFKINLLKLLNQKTKDPNFLDVFKTSLLKQFNEKFNRYVITKNHNFIIAPYKENEGIFS